MSLRRWPMIPSLVNLKLYQCHPGPAHALVVRESWFWLSIRGKFYKYWRHQTVMLVHYLIPCTGLICRQVKRVIQPCYKSTCISKTTIRLLCPLIGSALLKSLPIWVYLHYPMTSCLLFNCFLSFSKEEVVSTSCSGLLNPSW